MRYSWCAPLFIAVTCSIGATAQEEATTLPTTLQYEDTFNLEYPGSILFTHDGKNVIYERRSMDIMNDRVHTALWQVSLGGKKHRPLIAQKDSISQATLSPDGNTLAYVSGSQIYLYYFDSREHAKIATLPFSPSNVTWSHDSKSLAFSMFTQAKEKSLFTGMPHKPKGAKWADSAKFIERTHYRSDGAGYLPSGHKQLYILPVTGGTPRQLTIGDFPSSGSLAFAPDNKSIYFAANRTEDYALNPLSSDLYQVNINTREITQITSMKGPEYSPQLSPDGKKLAFKQLNDRKLSYQNADVMVLDLASGEFMRITSSFDRAIQDFYWKPDSEGIIFSYLDHGEHRIADADLTGNIDKIAVTLGGQSMGRPYTSGDFAINKNGDIAFTLANMNKPADLALIKAGNNKHTVLTDLNSDALGHLTLAEVKPLEVKSSVDARKIDAWVAYPPNFDGNKNYPLILEIHGGPHAAYGPHFSMEVQLMASKGYMVVWSNPRGSSSYGEDFGNLIHHNYPSQDYNDLMDVVDAAIAKGNVDADNLFITGGSGGGVLTAWSIGKTDRFKAAVVAKPVINWMSFTLTADAYPFFSQYWMPDMPWNIADQLWKRSPLSLVGNVTTPTLMLTGEADYRTPISESEQFYQALRLKGVDAAMVRIPGAPHGIASKPSRLIQKVGNILAWFERYQDKEATNQSETATAH
ncbi:S9 family peptidase [Alteromonas sp. ASW11-130]|uniref:S9 family peptidase n=1 Tax=Alteromonas sp. ASW11-130 TaxID=3015775 RepID=UPI0022427599|nr:S9 family peptidase [Alteromonas sp. ASW11-130]MCW8090853.1 S9 family peptidase [Alteromonas sp. ASW11-130]